MAVGVLHLIQRFYVGGAERQFIERLRAHPSGFEPVVGCLEASGGNLPDFRALAIGPPAVFPIRGSLARPGTALQIFRIARLIRRRGIRIVHGTDFVTNLLGLLAARLAGARAVVSRVDLGHLRAGFGPLRRRVEKRVSAAADTVCANAEAVRCLCLLEEGCRPEQVVVVRNGIDLERFDRLAALAPEGPLPEGDPLVAVIANLWPVKGHAVLLEAAARVRAQLPGARFALVGDGPERPALVRRAEALGLGDAVRFLGTRYDVPALLSRAHALCHPSHAEGLPNALMEGMAARLPAVATAVGGIPELIEDGLTGYLVRPCDPAALADRLVALLADRDQARAMGLRARAKAERELSIVRMREGYRSLYCRLLDASPAPTPRGRLTNPGWRALAPFVGERQRS